MDEPAAIATHYQLETGRPPVLLGGRKAYPAIDKRDATRRLVAVPMEPFRPARGKFLARALGPVPHAMLPVDHGGGADPSGRPAWFILCPAPPGPPLSAAPYAWSEAEVINGLLLPAAAALEALHDQGLTHRAIRPDNVFRAGRGERAVLGPCWAAPPAADQPMAYEPPYSAMCLPCARGDGHIADDVYALGVTMLWCVLGGQVEWPDEPILMRKLASGTFETLGGGRHISPTLADLLRVMLAEDPEHRPSPSLLQDPTQARARRVAQRPPQRAQRPLDIGGIAAWTARELALAMARQPEAADAALKSGAVDRWLRRILGDSQLAVALDDAVFKRGADPETEDARSEPQRVMRAILVLDPLAPLAWRGRTLLPDGVAGIAAWCLGPEGGGWPARLEELVCHDIVTHWAAPQPRRRAELTRLAAEAKDWRRLLTTRGPTGGMRRLAYTLNPYMACASPFLGGRWAVRLPALLPALEAAAPQADRSRRPMDGHLIAFIAAHAEGAMVGVAAGMDGVAGDKDGAATLGLYARLQPMLHAGPLPGLATWLLESGVVDLTAWHNLRVRAALREQLAAAAQSGQIPAMFQLARNESAQAADRTQGAQAAARVQAITAEMAALRSGGARRAAAASRSGQDIAAGIGMIGAVAAAAFLALAP